MVNFKLNQETLESLQAKDLLVQDYGLKLKLLDDPRKSYPYAYKSSISCITPRPHNSRINVSETLPDLVTIDFGFGYSLLKSNQKGLLCELEMNREGLEFDLTSFVSYKMGSDYTGGTLKFNSMEDVYSVVKLGEGTTTSDFSLKKLEGRYFFGKLEYTRRAFLKRGEAIPTFLCEYPVLSVHIPSCFISHLGEECSLDKEAFFYSDIMVQSREFSKEG